MKKSFNSITLCLVFVAIIIESCTSRTFNFVAVWLKRPYKGPQCVVQVIGVDLDPVANKRFDYWSNCDPMVEVRHSRWERRTQIEGNTYSPRYLWSVKMPYQKKKGFGFTVLDANVLEANHVMGRAFLTAEEVQEMKSNNTTKILSLGDGIGIIKVGITSVPKQLNVPINKNMIDNKREDDLCK